MKVQYMYLIFPIKERMNTNEAYYKRTGEYRIEIIEPSKLSGITTIFNGEK